MLIMLLPGESAAQTTRPRSVLVGMRPMVQAAQIHTLQQRVGAPVKKSLARGRVLVMDVPAGESEVRFKSKLLMDPAVAFVEPNGMMYPAVIPDDPEYPQQHHLPIIRAPEAWNVTTGSPEIVIAVVDTGVDTEHPDLAANIYRNPNESLNGRDDDGNGFIDDIHGWDFQNNTNNPRPQPTGADENNDGTPDEQVSHGTLVAGLAAAVGNNGFGTAGVAWNVKILPIQVFPSDGGASVSQVIEGIEYAIMMGADIINLSIGGGYYESFTAPIQQAHEQGILVVSAAGNGGNELRDSQTSWESPVCNDGPNVGTDNFVLGVGSTDANDLRASFSNFDGSSWGTFVDVMAPGEGLFGPAFYDPSFPAFSSYFTTNSGTSFSVPLVSGLAALILSQNPGMSPAQLMAAIKGGCDNIDALNPGFAGKLGAGRINCARSLGVPLAPRSVRDLRAFDTPDDQGGSVTLQWQRSLDDGSGADNVTEYIILRRRGQEGSFSEVARVGAGVTEYFDTSVTDGVTYYYQVRTSDGSLTSDSQVVGPVVPVNDGAPSAVNGVYAEDRPADDGGAIIVGWDTYSAPEDFSHFAIYRARTNFSSVAGMGPIAEVSDAGATEYVDATTTDGLDYWYAVTAVDTFGNQVTDVTAVGPVQSFANGMVTLSAGMHLFGSPLEPADREPTTLLGIDPGQLKMARWSSSAETYVVYSGPGSLPLVLGRGYWLKLDRPVTFSPSGKMAPSGSFSVTLEPGWQQIGNPFFSPIDLSQVTVNYQGTTMDLASADAANVMRQVLWTYDEQSNGYNVVAPFLGVGETRIDPWKGFWVRVEKRCSLVLPRGSSASAAMQAASVRSAEVSDGWFTRLSVRGEAGVDADNFFGVSRSLASMGPLNNPPPVAGGVDLAFVDTAGNRLAGQFAPVEARELTWDLVVSGSPGERIEVWCPRPGEIADGWAVTLEDVATGAAVDIRRGARYATTLGSAETQRSLTLRLTRTGGPLTLSSLSAVGSRAGGAQVSFTLSAPADCSVRVLNIAGRTIRVLQQGTPMPAGTTQLMWDGRSDAGLAVPNGTYLIQVEAAAEDGGRTQAVRTLAIGR
ncbi:MAG: S8 family serine peptidase [Armatimonadota bacterium]